MFAFDRTVRVGPGFGSGTQSSTDTLTHQGPGIENDSNPKQHGVETNVTFLCKI